MEQNYFLLIIIILTVLFKALADGFNYKYNTEKNEVQRTKFGIIYHIFGVFTIGIPVGSVLITNITGFDFVFVLIGFSLIYFGLFDIIYNAVTGRNLQYIGKTDIFDIMLRKIFNKKPFSKTILLTIRWGCFILGIIFILDFI